jgi:isocitrate/isopropylmalate dehydrogenase
VLEVVTAASTDVELKLETHEFGGCAIDKTGEALTDATLQACKSADAILMGAYFPMIQPSRYCTSFIRCDWWAKMGCQQQSAS